VQVVSLPSAQQAPAAGASAAAAPSAASTAAAAAAAVAPAAAAVKVEYATKEEAKAGFKELLAAVGCTPTSNWDEVRRLGWVGRCVAMGAMALIWACPSRGACVASSWPARLVPATGRRAAGLPPRGRECRLPPGAACGTAGQQAPRDVLALRQYSCIAAASQLPAATTRATPNPPTPPAQIFRRIVNDPRFGALATLGEKKSCFHEFVQHLKNEEKDSERRKAKQAREDFTALLEESGKVDSRTKWVAARVTAGGGEGQRGRVWPARRGLGAGGPGLLHTTPALHTPERALPIACSPPTTSQPLITPPKGTPRPASCWRATRAGAPSASASGRSWCASSSATRRSARRRRARRRGSGGAGRTGSCWRRRTSSTWAPCRWLAWGWGPVGGWGLGLLGLLGEWGLVGGPNCSPGPGPLPRLQMGGALGC
jgi:hypothetical protein